MGKTTNLQDPMLNKIRTEQVPVSIYLTNGVQLRGVIKGFDNFIVMLEGEGRQMMVYKHAITTIAPIGTTFWQILLTTEPGTAISAISGTQFNFFYFVNKHRKLERLTRYYACAFPKSKQNKHLCSYYTLKTQQFSLKSFL